MANKLKVTVVIPTYDEEGSIEKTITEIPRKYIDEIIVVDRSSDRTAQIAKRLGCRVLRQQGKGFGNALRQGIENASGDIVLIMDADGSQNPRDIPMLINRVREGYDYVLASRYTVGSHSEDDTLLRSFGNWLITWTFNRMFHVNTSDSIFLFTAVRKKEYERLNLRSDGFEYCIELLAKAYVAGLKMVEIPSIERKRYAGRTKVNDFLTGYNLLKSIFLWRLKLAKPLKRRLSKK